MGKKILIFLGSVFVFCSLKAQNNEIKPFLKHEIGFSVGVLPLIGFLDPDALVGLSADPMFVHTYYLQGDNGNYENMRHFGSYTFNYNYHFNSKRSLGGSVSWVGKHIDTYWKYSPNLLSSANDTIDGRGWKHYFTVQANYRNTYYRNDDNIALYWGISFGITLCVRDRNILPKETLHLFLSTISNDRYIVTPAMHINAFGIEFGEKYKFHLELGFGTQGLVKTGFRYKF